MTEGANSKKTAAFMRFEYLEGSLDGKTRELVLLAAASAAGCAH